MCKNIRAPFKSPFLVLTKVWYNILNGGAFGTNAMTQSLEEYIAQATQAYKPASNAVQSQLDALDSRLATTNEQINRNYNQQQADLNRSRNMAAESASMQAAGSGGSFGGSANLANRRYYDKTFVPAVTQMKTNQANDLASARQSIEDTRNNLNSQMANIEAQANQQALAQYYADLEAERNRQAQLQAQREANAAQNAYYQYLMDQMNAQSSPTIDKSQISFTDWLNNDSYGALDAVSGNSLGEKISALKTIASLYNANNNPIGRQSGLVYKVPLYQEYLKWRNS